MSGPLPDRDPTRALAAVEGFVRALAASPTPATYHALLAESPDLLEDLLAFLHARVVEGRAGDGLSRYDGDPLFWELAAELAGFATPEQRGRLFDGIVFRVFHPEAYRLLAPIVRVALAPKAAEAMLLERVRGDDPMAAHLARELAYHLFGGGADYPLSEAGRDVLDVG